MYLYNFILAIRPNIENNLKGILIIQISKVSLINNDSSNAIENELKNIYNLLNQDEIPKYTESCSFCEYHKKLNQKHSYFFKKRKCF